MLEDDLHFFPPYDAAAIATDEVLAKNPKIRTALKRLEGTINTREMQKLNYRADNDLVEPSVIAEDFLKQHNYFEKE